MDFDVIVIGHGGAGLSAAVSAAEGGARVAILERAKYEERGGNSRYTDAWMRLKSEESVSDDFIDRLSGAAHGAIPPDYLKEATKDYDNWPQNLKAYAFTDPEIISTWADSAPPTIAWLKANGVQITYNSVMLLQGGIEQFPTALADQLKDGGRAAAVFVDGMLGVVRVGVKQGGAIRWRDAFNATAPVLDGFARPRAFAL